MFVCFVDIIFTMKMEKEHQNSQQDRIRRLIRLLNNNENDAFRSNQIVVPISSIKIYVYTLLILTKIQPRRKIQSSTGYNSRSYHISKSACEEKEKNEYILPKK